MRSMTCCPGSAWPCRCCSSAWSGCVCGASRPSAGSGLFRAPGAVARARTDAWMVAAGIRALLVDGAHAGLAIQVHAVAVAHAGQGEDAGLLVEAFDQAFLLQPLGDVLRRLAALEFVDHAKT